MPLLYLRPASTHTDPGLTLNGTSPLHACIDDPVGFPDDASTSISHPGASPYWVTPEVMPDAISIAGVNLVTRAREIGGVGTSSFTPAIKIGSVKYDSGIIFGLTASSAWTAVEFNWLNDPSTGLQWTTAGVRALIFGGTGILVADEIEITQQYLAVDCVITASKISGAREVGSRTQRLYRSLISLANIDVPLLFADAELGTIVSVKHQDGPSTQDEGWRSKVWQRSQRLVTGFDLDLDNMVVRSIETLGLRRYRTSFWYTGRTNEIAGSQDDGVCLLASGAGLIFTRASEAYVESGTAQEHGSRQVLAISNAVKKHEYRGVRLEPARSNYLLGSAFVDGVSTYWTPTNASDEPGVLLFDKLITTKACKLTRTGAGQARIEQGVAFTGSETLVLSVEHYDFSGSALLYQVIRGDGKFWRDSDSTWQVSDPANTFPVSANAYARHHTKVMTLNAGAQTVTVKLLGEVVSGQVTFIAHAQLEVGDCMTSWIVTRGVSVRRDDDLFKVENFTGKRVWISEQGGGTFGWRPAFNAGQITTDRVLLDVYHDASNFERVTYEAGTDKLLYQRRAAGVTYTATSAAISAAEGVLVNIGLRHTGANAELDLAPYTISIFVNGVKGTDAVAADLTQVASPYMYLGSRNDGANGAVGWFSDCDFTDAVLYDDEFVGRVMA